MNRQKKIEVLKGIAEGKKSIFDLYNYILIVRIGGKYYLTDGKIKGREITDLELALIESPKVFLDEQDMNL